MPTRARSALSHREIDRAGHAIGGEFVFRSDVDNLVKFGHLCYVYRRWSPHSGPCRAAFFRQFHGSCLRVSALLTHSLRENMAVPDEKTGIRLTQLSHGGG